MNAPAERRAAARTKSASETFRVRGHSLTVASAVGLAMTAPGVALGALLGMPALIALAIPGLTVAFGAFAYARVFAFHCPACRENFARPSLTRTSYSIRLLCSAKFRTCPCCGQDFDAVTIEGVPLTDSSI